MSKASKFGIDTNNLDFAKIDLMKDLERARTSLATKLDNSQMECINNDTSLPLEEMKYIEWHSDGSDEEGFQKVSNTTTKQAFVPGHLSWQPLGPGQLVAFVPGPTASRASGGGQGPFVLVGGTNRDKRPPFCPGWCLQPGRKAPVPPRWPG